MLLRRSKNHYPVSGRIFDLKSSRVFLEKELLHKFWKSMHGEKDYLFFIVPRRSTNNNPVSGRIFGLKSNTLFLEKELLHTFVEHDVM